MAVDLEDEGRSVGMLRGIFDQEQGLPLPDTADLLVRAEIALAELVRWLRREEDRIRARAGRAFWNESFLRGYADGRRATAPAPIDRTVMPSHLLPPRSGMVCTWCRAAIGEEVSGFGLDEAGVARALGDDLILDNLARELGADIPGHRCDARDGLGTCACGCAVWREQRRHG